MIRIREMISQYAKLLKPKEVLDLGCGKGMISLRFAEMGANVTGVDKREQEFANRNFNFIQQDIRDFKFSKNYDLIITAFVLHFISNSDAIKTIRKIKNHTKIGGYNFLVCLSEKDGFCNKGKFYSNSNKLKELYYDWKIIKFNQGFTPMEEHGNLKPHRHNLIFMLARKTNKIHLQHCGSGEVNLPVSP